MDTKNNGNNHKNDLATKAYVDQKFKEYSDAIRENGEAIKDLKNFMAEKFEDFAKNMTEKFDLFAHKYIMPLWTDMQVVKGDIKVMKGDINVIKSDIVVIKSDIVEMKIDISDLKKDMKDVKKTVHKHDVQITALRDWTRVNQ